MKMLNYYDYLWKKRCRVGNTITLPILPKSIINQVTLELSWELYKHSHLFRRCPVSFRRVVSSYITYDFYLPGQIIYSKNKIKDRMIYLITGVIQILDTDDDETPIISLSGGTCLGEASLLLGLTNVAKVVSATHCEVLTLDRKNFIKIMLIYTKYFKRCMKSINERVDFAIDLHTKAESEVQKRKEDIESSYVQPVKWLKLALKMLMKHKTIDIEEMSCVQDNILYTPVNLDLLVVSEKREIVTDKACLKAKWPWIFQPESSFLKIWDKFVLIHTVILSILIAYYASYGKLGSRMLVLGGIFLQVTNIFDLYVQTSTAVRTKEELVSEWKQILLIRLTQPGFVADAFAAFPTWLILLLTTESSAQSFVLMQFHTLLKLWRVGHAFSVLEHIYVSVTDYIRIVKFTSYLLYFSYLSAAVLFIVSCRGGTCASDSWMVNAVRNIDGPEDPFVIGLYFSFMYTLGIGFSKMAPQNTLELLTLTWVVSISFVYILYGIASVTAAKILIANHRIKFYERVNIIRQMINQYDLNPSMYSRIMAFLKCQWIFNEGITIRYGVKTFYDISKELDAEMLKEICAQALSNVPVLQGIDEEFINQVSTTTRHYLLPPNEVIILPGKIPDFFIVILTGYCEVAYILEGYPKKIIGPGSYILDVEMLCNIPMVAGVRTVTYCKLVAVDNTALKQILLPYPQALKDIKETVQNSKELMGIFDEELLASSGATAFTSYATEETKSFKYFCHCFKPGRAEEADYQKPFDNIYLKIIGFFLIRIAILPDGTFLKAWEILRALCALFTALLHPLHALFQNEILYYIVRALDISAYIDMFVRFNVAYYNKNNLLVTHPYKTAVNYLTRSFILDFVACFPFEIFLNMTEINHEFNKDRLFACMNRLLQCYRILLGDRYLREDVTKRNALSRVVIFIIFIILYLNWVSCFYMAETCKLYDSHETKHSKIYATGVDCGNHTWIGTSAFPKPLDKLNVFLYTLLWMTSIHAIHGQRAIYVRTNEEAIAIMIFSAVGLLCTFAVLPSIITSLHSVNGPLIKYQGMMKSLVNFMKKHRINSDLQIEVINYFELIWKKRQGRDVHNSIYSFNSALKEDILYKIFSQSLLECPVLRKAGRTLCNSILKNVKAKLYMTGAIIIQVNDVHPNLYIVNKGRVEVQGPGGMKLQGLKQGSMFGNVHNTSMVRQAVTIVAKGHAEVLIINATRFYSIVQNYPKIWKIMDYTTQFHTDYIPNDIKSEARQEKEPKAEEGDSASGSSAFFSRLGRFNIIFSPHNTAVEILEIFADAIFSNISYFLTLYQAAVKDFGATLFLVSYFLDLFYLVNIYFRFHTGYFDDFGNAVKHRKEIAKRYIRSPLGLYFHLVTLLPLEIFALFAPRGERILYVCYLRLNRVLRILATLEFFKQRSNKLNINVFWMRLNFIVIISSSLIHFCVCTAIFLGEEEERHIWTETTGGKVHLYFRNLQIVTNTFTCARCSSFVPASAATTLYMSFFILFSKILVTVFIGEICNMVVMVDFVLHRYIRTISSLQAFLKANNVHIAVINEFWDYLKYLWFTNRGTQFPALLEEAPYYLVEGIKNNAFAHHITTNFIFSNCHQDFLRQLITHLQLYTFYPGNYIAFHGDIDNCIYFIHSGEIHVKADERNEAERSAHVLNTGDVFGMEEGLHENRPHKNSYQAITVCEVLSLNYKEWNYLLSFFHTSRREIYSRAASLNYV